MNAVSLSPDAAKLRAIRASLAAIAPGEWSRVHGKAGAFVEARGEMGELLVLARFDAASVDEIDFICNAPDTVAFLLALLDRSIDTIHALKGTTRPAPEPQRREKNYAAECALKCAESGFQRFLETCHGLEPPLTAERAAQKVRSLLGVQSRAELNNGGHAAAAWQELRRAYDRHRRGQG